MCLPRLVKSFARVVAAALLLCSPQAGAQLAGWVDPGLRWRTLDTEHFSVHFAERHRPQAHIAAEVAERVYPRITGMLRWQPRSRTHLVVLDSADFANGFASPLPFNHADIFLSPPDEGELLQNRDWLELVLTHEFFHIVHMDKARRAPLTLRNIFGRTPWVPPIFSPFPNVAQPPWILEGLAVYAESEAGSGHGRLENSAFEGMMRAERSRGLRSLREINAGGRGFPLNRDYLYGAYFFAFMRERYGEKAVLDFIEDYSDNIVPFRVHSNPVRVTGKPMDVLWEDYQDWLRTRFAPKPGAAAGAGGEGEVLARAFSLSSPVLARGATRWYVQADGYTRPKLVRQAAGGPVETVREVEPGTRLAPAAGDSIVLAQFEICGNRNLLYDLYRVDARGDTKRLTQCGRNRFAVPLDDGRIVALRVETGEAEVVVLDQGGALERSLYRAAPGESLSGLAAKADTVVVTSLRDGRWSLLEIAGGKVSVLLSDAAIKHSPRFGRISPDAPDEIFFVADYGKVYNVWSLARASGALSRWTQATNGVQEISAPLGGEMLLTTIEADGDALRLHRLPEAPLERRAAPSSSPVGPEAPRAEIAAAGLDRPYSPWSSLRPRAWLPIAEIADGTFALGVVTYGQDALGLHQYVVAPMYEFTQRELLGSAAYVYDDRHSLLINRTLTVKVLLDREPTAYSIKEDAQWVSTWRHLALNRRFYWGLGAALEREKLHQVDDGTSSLQNERVLGLVAGVDTRREQWLSEGPSQGQSLRLFAETSNGLHAAFSGNVYRADWRGHLALGKTVLGLRWNEAYGQPGAEAFQLGGSRSDEYIALPVLNQREFALRGYISGEPALNGHRARIATAEWRVPLADIDRHFMVPPVGLNRVSLNFFFDVGDAWDRGNSPDYHRGIGVELMSEPRFGYLLGLSMRLGLARGLDTAGTTQVYLRLGRSF